MLDKSKANAAGKDEVALTVTGFELFGLSAFRKD
jgi:hypothetical protein